METPFSDILNQMEQAVRSRQVDQNPVEKILIFCSVQLRLLHTQYRSMSEFSLLEQMERMRQASFDYEDQRYKSTKAVLDYFSFLNILNQFGRILKSRYRIPIPKYNRIKFFRNKVLEHWETYTEYGHSGSLTQKSGEPAVPSISTSIAPEERKKIKEEIDQILATYSISLEIKNPEVVNISDQPENVEKIYLALEAIDQTLSKKEDGDYIIPGSLTKLLFKFGFPTPLANIKEYSNELVEFLK